MKVFGEVIRRTPQKRQLKKCIGCEKKTLNPKFCSSNCSATYNNKFRKAFHPPAFCKKCNTRIHYKAQFCWACMRLDSVEKFGEKTLGDFRKLPAIAKNRYVPVRQHAARVMKYHKLKKDNCLLCSYSNHVQLCHIKDIGDFSDDTTVRT